MEIQTSIRKQDDIIVFTITDREVTHNNSASLKEKLFLEIADGNKQIVLDMLNVKEMDSSGLGALLFGKRQANNAGGNVVFVSENPHVQTMIRIAQLSHVFEFYPTVEDALKSF
ncbi:MAG: STAS domain-containing protein [Calditrichia bacterium]